MANSLRLLLTFSLILVGLTYPGFAQNTDMKPYTYSFESYVSKGFVVAHDQEMAHLSQTHPEGISLVFKKHTYGFRDWEKSLNYPDIGVAVQYFDHKNPVLGKTVSAFSFLDYYIVRRPKSSFNFQFGFGFCYATNPYHSETNNKNIALGSTLTYGAHAQLAYNRKIADRLGLISAVRLSHYSNGAYTKPNKGLNVATFDMGISYSLNEKKREYITWTQEPVIDRRIRYSVYLASGLKEIDEVKNKKFTFLTLSMYASKQVSPKNSWNFGLDGFYSLATKKQTELDAETLGTKPDFKRVGLVGGHELMMGRLSLLTQLGVYVYRPYKADKPVYQRYGLKFAFTDNIFGGLLLKTHYGKAEAVEWGIGVRI